MMKIIGYFSEISAANKTVEKLKNLGCVNAIVDINDHYIGNRNIKTNLAGTEHSESLSDLVLNSGSDDIDRSKSPLSAFSPMVSGFGRFEEITDINYKVIVECEKEESQKVKEVIHQMGGEFDDPNVSRYKMISDSDVVLEKAINKIDRDINI